MPGATQDGFEEQPAPLPDDLEIAAARKRAASLIDKLASEAIEPSEDAIRAQLKRAMAMQAGDEPQKCASDDHIWVHAGCCQTVCSVCGEIA